MSGLKTLSVEVTQGMNGWFASSWTLWINSHSDLLNLNALRVISDLEHLGLRSCLARSWSPRFPRASLAPSHASSHLAISLAAGYTLGHRNLPATGWRRTRS